MAKAIKYYHASPRRFRHGDVLTGGHGGGAGVVHDAVCMTDSPAPHGTILGKAIGGDWFVYEVRPLYGVGYCDGNSEFQTLAAEVVRLVGRSRALAAKRQEGARFDEHFRAYLSFPPPRPRRGVRTRIRRHIDRLLAAV